MQPASGALLTQASYRLWLASRQIEPVDAAAGASVAIEMSSKADDRLDALQIIS